MQIVSVAKWRGMQIAQLVQGTGSRAWVELTDLVASSHSITVAQVHFGKSQSLLSPCGGVCNDQY